MRRLQDLTYPEAQAILERGAIGLWPIGSTEAHGPHLPLATDVIIAEETCRRAGERLRAISGLEPLLLPSLAFTVTDFARPFSGTLSISKETVIALVRDVALHAASLGFRIVCLVNAHLEPAHRFALRDAVKAAKRERPRSIALADPCDRRWAETLTDEFKAGACHAGAYETSLVLASNPEAVRRDIQRSLEAVNIDLLGRIRSGAKDFLEAGAPRAYFGDPRRATPAEGEATYAKLVDMVCTVIHEELSETLS